jgi:hypothetical protein
LSIDSAKSCASIVQPFVKAAGRNTAPSARAFSDPLGGDEMVKADADLDRHAGSPDDQRED